MSIIEKESKRLSSLSKQLLTLSFLNKGLDDEAIQPFDIAKQLREVVSSTEYQWRQKEITIELDISSSIVTGYPQLMEIVWMNLVTNAIRYTDSQGIITLTIKQNQTTVIVTVEDTGIGISKEHLPHLFERFYKVDKARTRTDNSTGLGLAIVKEIIELHEGTIMVESERGEGTIFQVTIPKVFSPSQD